MSTPDKSVLRLIKMSYEGDELTAALLAWNDFPTMIKDCPTERAMKERARQARMKKYLAKIREGIK
jgi:hypothetical protein